MNKYVVISSCLESLFVVYGAYGEPGLSMEQLPSYIPENQTPHHDTSAQSKHGGDLAFYANQEYSKNTEWDINGNVKKGIFNMPLDNETYYWVTLKNGTRDLRPHTDHKNEYSVSYTIENGTVKNMMRNIINDSVIIRMDTESAGEIILHMTENMTSLIYRQSHITQIIENGKETGHIPEKGTEPNSCDLRINFEKGDGTIYFHFKEVSIPLVRSWLG